MLMRHLSIVSGLLLFVVAGMGGLRCQDCPKCPCPQPCQQEPIAVPDRTSPEVPTQDLQTPDPGTSEQQAPDRQAPPERVVVVESPPAERGVPEVPPALTRCGPPTATFYQTPSGLPAQAGALLRCETLGVQPAAVIGADPRYAGNGAAAVYAVRVFRIMYVTESPPGQFQAATSLVYIPEDSAQKCVPSAPVTLVAHGTTGMAPHCGPSRFPDFGLHHLVWPLAGRGQVVVAPDLLGLGTPASGGHPYLITTPTQQAMYDAVKATAILGTLAEQSGCVGRRVLLLGHSQGGHAALVGAQGFGPGLPGFQLAGTVAIAPAFGDERVWLGPFQATLRTGIPTAYFLAYLLAAARYNNGPALSTWLTAKAASLIPGWLDSFCFTEWSALLVHNFPTFGDLFQPAFLTASQACQAGSGDCKAFAPWLAAIRDSLIQGSVVHTPTLLVQGGQDAVVSATSVGCLKKRFDTNGATVSLCVVPAADHISVIAASWSGTLAWIEAVLQGKVPPLPTCASTTLPACP